MQLIIDTANTQLSVKNKCFFISNKSRQAQVSPKRISSIAITTDCNLNAAVIKLAAIHQIPILFFNNFGTLQARLWSPYFKNIANLRKKQYLFVSRGEATTWMIDVLKRKTSLQTGTLRKFVSRRPRHKAMIKKTIEAMQSLLDDMLIYQDVPITQCRQNIMGIEGSISKRYWTAVSVFLPENFQFKTRSRRPAKDYFNAGLNYLYGMTYGIVESGVFDKGLDPMIGILHIDGYKRTSLVFDLIEPIRPLIDRLLIRLCQERKLDATHFIQKPQGYWLSKKGKRKIIPDFNDYLYKRIKINKNVKRLKDIIFNESNQLGNLIDQTIKNVTNDLHDSV